jgi:hypothetical protein
MAKVGNKAATAERPHQEAKQIRQLHIPTDERLCGANHDANIWDVVCCQPHLIGTGEGHRMRLCTIGRHDASMGAKTDCVVHWAGLARRSLLRSTLRAMRLHELLVLAYRTIC